MPRFFESTTGRHSDDLSAPVRGGFCREHVPDAADHLACNVDEGGYDFVSPKDGVCAKAYYERGLDVRLAVKDRKGAPFLSCKAVELDTEKFVSLVAKSDAAGPANSGLRNFALEDFSADGGGPPNGDEQPVFIGDVELMKALRRWFPPR